MASNVEAMSCPFCDFTDKDSYFLLQHVELIHPENGESPFIIQDEEVPSRAYQGEDVESPQQSQPNTPSRSPEQNDYIKCPYDCGELVASAELSSHKDFHLAERMALTENGQSSEMHFSTGACNEAQTAEDISKHFTTDLPKSLRNRDQLGSTTPLRTEVKKSSPLREFLFGTPASPRRRSPIKAHSVTDGGARRLGVSP